MESWPDRNFFERQRFLVKHELYLQGLRMVPLGLLFLSQAAIEAGVLRVAEWVELVSVAVAFGLVVVIQAIYCLFYGRPVYPSSSSYGSALARRARKFGVFCLFALLAIGFPAIDALVGLDVSLTGLLLAFMVFYFWKSWGDFRRHYGVMAAVLFVASFAPTFGIAEPWMFVGTPLMTGTIGFGMAVGGVVDHVMLMRMRVAVEGGVYGGA